MYLIIYIYIYIYIYYIPVIAVYYIIYIMYYILIYKLKYYIIYKLFCFKDDERLSEASFGSVISLVRLIIIFMFYLYTVA